MQKLGIIVALTGEKKTLSRALNNLRPSDRASILVQLAGMGPENAKSAAHHLIASGCDALLSWGCAAALEPELTPGDCLIPKRIVSNHYSAEIDVDELWHQRVCDRLSPMARIISKPLAESRDVVSGSTEKILLGERTKACGLDMESGAIAKVATDSSIPFLVIRSIADPASMSLPNSVVIATDTNGGLNIPKLLLHTLFHPSNIAGLIQLGINFRSAQISLTRSARLLSPDFCITDNSSRSYSQYR